MSIITRTSFSTGDIPTASQWNTQFDTIYNEFNGNISLSNLDTSFSNTIAFNNGAETISGNWTFSASADFTAPVLFSASANFGSNDISAVGSITAVSGNFTGGNISLINLTGGQIAFPATQSASSGANTLDDYEEGTITPTITFGGGNTGLTYSYQVGRYTKIGDTVHYTIHVTLTAKGSSTGELRIGGLPFSATSDSNVLYAAPVFITGGSSSWNSPVSFVDSGATTIRIYNLVSGTQTISDDTYYTDSSNIIVTGHYQV